MKKSKTIFVILSAAILGLFESCFIPCECYDYREWMTPIRYSDTEYNTVKALPYKFLSPPIAELSNADWYRFHPAWITSEDSTVQDQEIRVFGFLYADKHHLQDVNLSSSEKWSIANVIDVSYDTSDHAICDKLNGLTKYDTVYIKGHLRLFITCWEEDERFFICSYRVPGVYIYSADDITIAPKQDEDI